MFLPAQWGPSQLRASMFGRGIVWPQSKVYYAPDGGLRINLRGREPEGIVAPGGEYEALRHELRAALNRLIDPGSGRSPVDRVYLAEELYEGPYLQAAPDLIVEPQRENDDPEANYLLDGSVDDPTSELFGPADPYSGNHALDGILMAAGPDVGAGQWIEDAHITDIAPTVLAALALGIPERMDGRVLSGLFEPGRAPEARPIAGDQQVDLGVEAEPFNDEDSLAVERRLRDLGYLD
jgi:predicted AlkP superfamily phosphohydrolase/phosphomutase